MCLSARPLLRLGVGKRTTASHRKADKLFPAFSPHFLFAQKKEGPLGDDQLEEEKDIPPTHFRLSLSLALFFFLRESESSLTSSLTSLRSAPHLGTEGEEWWGRERRKEEEALEKGEGKRGKGKEEKEKVTGEGEAP